MLPSFQLSACVRTAECVGARRPQRAQCTRLLRACAGEDVDEAAKGASKRKAREARGAPRPKRRRAKQKHRAKKDA